MHRRIGADHRAKRPLPARTLHPAFGVEKGICPAVARVEGIHALDAMVIVSLEE